MENSKLWTLLSSFSMSEWSQFGTFLQSPMHNRRRELIDLHAFLWNWRQSNETAPAKADLHKSLFPDKEFQAQSIRQVMSELYQCAESFLLWLDLQDRPLERQVRLSHLLRQRKLAKSYAAAVRKAEHLLEKAPKRDAAYFQHKYHLAQTQYRYSSAERRTGEQNIADMALHLQQYHRLSLLRVACLSLAHRAVYKGEEQELISAEWLQDLEQDLQDQVPGIRIYYYCYLALIRKDDEQVFKSFVRELLAHPELFSFDETRDLFLLAVNYYIRRLNEGDRYLAPEAMDFFRTGLERGLLMRDGQLSRFTYRNIVSMGLMVGQFDWVEKFIHDYQSYLPEQHRNSTFNFNLAKLAYEQSKYDEALLSLQSADYEDLLLNLAAKTLMAKIYYETNSDQALDAHLLSMKAFIYRKKIIGYHRKNYLNLIRILQKLLRINPFQKNHIEALKIKIQETEVLTEKKWLLTQINKL